MQQTIPQNDLVLYRRGLDVFLGLNCKKQDFQEGFRLLQLSNHPDAVWLVALLERNGIPRNHSEAMNLFLEQRNDARSLCFAALVNSFDSDLLVQSAEMGFALSQAFVADYHLGDDNTAGFEWAKRSAQQHEPMGLCILGHCYRLGKGVPQDHRAAFSAYQEAADAGFVQARLWLACEYLQRQDMLNFFHWLGTSISGGNGDKKMLFEHIREFVSRIVLPSDDVAVNHVIFEIGSLLSKHIQVETRRVWGVQVSDDVFEYCIQTVKMNLFWCEKAKEVSFWWIACAKRLGVPVEIRQIVGKLIWEDRVNGTYPYTKKM